MNISMQIFSYILFNNSNSLGGSARYAAAAAGNTQDENIIDIDDEFDNFMADW